MSHDGDDEDGGGDVNPQLLEAQFFAHGSSWQVAAFYFTDTGEIVYFTNMDFIVVSPHWLGRGVLGEMIDTFTPGCNSSIATRGREFADKGILEEDAWETLLRLSLEKAGLQQQQQQQVMDARQLIQLMLNLNLCYESRNKYNVVKGYFVPVLLEMQGSDDGSDGVQLAWLSETEDLDRCFFTGLRLQCSNMACTFLTPGFFPRLQVMLYNYYLENGWIGPGKQESLVEINVEMFAITALGFDILVEYSGSLGFYVDILVRSIRHPLQTAEFVHKHVVEPIRSFCASQEGCMGVHLEEHVLRQECVKHLTLRRYRKNQFVPTTYLTRKVEEANGDYYIQTWRRVAEDTSRPNVCVLNTRHEYATTVQGRVILGSKDDVDWARSSPDQQVPLKDCYPDTNVRSRKRRGLAVLISMENYKNGRYRWGGPVDRGRLEDLAHSLQLDNDCNMFLDCSANSIREELLHRARTRVLTDDECFVCFVNAHGGTAEDGAFFFNDCDGNRLSLLTDIVEPFRKCKNLVGKPKIFFVNACRGRLILGSMDDDPNGLGAGEGQSTPSSWSEGAEARYVENEADCLIVFSTSQQAASPRDREYGTNFAYALMRALHENRDSRDLLTILTLMTYDVVDMDVPDEDAASGKVRKLRQCPVFISSLRKLVYWRSV